MLQVHLQLYSVLREHLPPEAKGRALLDVDRGTTLADLLVMLNIKRRVVISVNGVHEPDPSRQVQDGDEVKMFSAVSGGTSAARLNRVKR